MKKVYISFLVFWLVTALQAQVHEWSRLIGGDMEDKAVAIIMDTSGNYYITGTFEDTVDFNASPGIHVPDTHISNGGKDIFISKYSSTGDYMWTLTIGGTEDDLAGDLIIGHYMDNIVLVGSFRSSVDFNPSSTSEYTLISAGENDAYIAEYNLNGALMLAYRIGGTGNDDLKKVVLNAENEEYAFLGTYSGTVDLNPHGGVANKTSNGGKDVFMTMLNSVDWVYNSNIAFGGTGEEYANGIVVDDSGSYYVCGAFNGEVNFNPGGPDLTRTANGMQDGFVLKYNSEIEPQWIQIFGGSETSTLKNIAVNNNDLYLFGEFTGTVTIGADEDTSAGFSDIVLLKYGILGNFLWGMHIEGPSYDWAYGVCVDEEGDIVICGSLQGDDVEFNPLGVSYTLSTNSSQDMYLAKYNGAGILQWAGTFGAVSDIDRAQSVITDNTGHYIIAGFSITGTYYPDPYGNQPGLTNHGGYDGVLGIYSDPSNAAEIVSFTIPGQVGSSVINSSGNTVSVTMPYGTNVTALVPAIITSDESGITPASNSATNFTSPVVYTVTAQNPMIRETWAVTVTVAAPSDGLNAQLNDITGFIFPNPANNYVTIQPVGNPGTIRILNQSGTCLKVISFSGNNPVEVDLKDFTPGVYFVRLDSDNTVYTNKLIILKELY